MKTNSMVVMVLALLLAGCAGAPSDDEISARALQSLKSSFKENGQAKLDRLDQDETQKLCSAAVGGPSKDVAARVEKLNMTAMKYPPDGKLLGDWRQGERIAQTGTGMQYSDDPKLPSGANCYACHQLAKAEISFGTIGPTLYNFGKLRGYSPEIQRYAYGKIYNPQAFTACSNMPRFGHNAILTEEQIRHLTALLMDPASPVNQ